MNFNHLLGTLNQFWPKALEEGGSFWMPPQASNFAFEVDWIFNYIYWISVFFFVLIVACMILFIVMFRQREGHKEQKSPTHNTPMELTWTIVPLLIVVTIFYFGFKEYVDKIVAPQNSYTIRVYGQKWQWFFEYPNGYQDQDLHVPVDVPVELIITSSDVTHSLYVPAFRVKMDAVPGRFNKMWFTATDVGDYQVFCAEYCGTSHSDMIARAVVHESGEFEKWLADASNFLDKDPPAVAGEKLYNKKGCAQCHSIDGSANHGPSFENIWGKEGQFQSGESYVFNEEYVRTSILYPQQNIVAGYEAVMPTFQGKLTDQEILAIIAYMKQLSGIEVSEVPIPQQLKQAAEDGAGNVDSATQTDGADTSENNNVNQQTDNLDNTDNTQETNDNGTENDE